MSTLAIVLVFLSSILHAAWNVMSKRSSFSGLSFCLSMNLGAAIFMTPFLLWYVSRIGMASLPISFWALLVLGGLFQVLYFASLLTAYKHADIGVAYPLARALPLLMVGLGSSLMGALITGQQWIGFAMIVAGCLLVPLSRLKEFKVSSYMNIGMLWAFGAALGTSGYSLTDKHALDIITASLGPETSHPLNAFFYMSGQLWATALPVLIWCLVTGQKNELRQAWQNRMYAGGTGLVMGLTYGLVLTAMTLTDNVSLVVALRQLSIVFGLIMGYVFLKEKWHLPRMAGVVMIVSGLILALS